MFSFTNKLMQTNTKIHHWICLLMSNMGMHLGISKFNAFSFVKSCRSVPDIVRSSSKEGKNTVRGHNVISIHQILSPFSFKDNTSNLCFEIQLLTFFFIALQIHVSMNYCCNIKDLDVFQRRWKSDVLATELLYTRLKTRYIMVSCIMI